MHEAEQPISLRTAIPDDQTFLLELFAGTRDDLSLANLETGQKQLLIELQFRARQNQYQFAYPKATNSIILEGVREVGSIIVNRGERDIHVVDISLLPECRNRGIGTRVLRTLLEEALAEAKSVGLQVAVTNRAITFYERLGFSTIKDGGAYISMVWRPPSQDWELEQYTARGTESQAATK